MLRTFPFRGEGGKVRNSAQKRPSALRLRRFSTAELGTNCQILSTRLRGYGDDGLCMAWSA